jgi:Protein of unknown function with HXXEE motif
MAALAGPTCAPPGAAPGLAYTLTALAFFAHNIDEILRLPGWAGARGLTIEPAGFANAVLVLTMAAVVVFVAGRTLQFARPVQAVVAVAAGALLANVAAHLAASLVTTSVMPGLLTSVFLVLPSAAWLMIRLPLPASAKWRAGLAGAALMPVLAGGALWSAGGLG